MSQRIQIIEKHCKSGDHEKCAGIYIGLNIEATCSCNCHKTKEGLGPDKRNQAPQTQTQPHEGLIRDGYRVLASWSYKLSSLSNWNN